MDQAGVDARFGFRVLDHRRSRYADGRYHVVCILCPHVYGIHPATTRFYECPMFPGHTSRPSSASASANRLRLFQIRQRGPNLPEVDQPGIVPSGVPWRRIPVDQYTSFQDPCKPRVQRAYTLSVFESYWFPETWHLRRNPLSLPNRAHRGFLFPGKEKVRAVRVLAQSGRDLSMLSWMAICPVLVSRTTCTG